METIQMSKNWWMDKWNVHLLAYKTKHYSVIKWTKILIYAIMWKILKKHFIFAFCFFRLHLRPMEVPRLGVNWNCSRWSTPQPQQHWIQAMSETHTTAHSNMGSLTHWARLGIEPASSWILVGLVTTESW